MKLIGLAHLSVGSPRKGLERQKQRHRPRVVVYGQVSMVITLLHNRTAKNQKRKLKKLFLHVRLFI